MFIVGNNKRHRVSGRKKKKKNWLNYFIRLLTVALTRLRGSYVIYERKSTLYTPDGYVGAHSGPVLKMKIYSQIKFAKQVYRAPGSFD